MPQSQVHNTDCITFMQSLPDNYFSLAIADPPYGDAGQNNANPHVDLGSRSRKYLKDTEITPPHNNQSNTTGSADGSSVTRTGGTWAAKYTKKSLRGTRPQMRSSLSNSFVSHAVKSSGVVTTSPCLLHAVL